jgi:hypothetical protein
VELALSQRGGISLPIVIAAALGLGFGASAFLNIAQFQRADQERKLLQGEITDLRYQVEQDKKNGVADASQSPSPSPSDSPSPSPSASPSPSPAVAGASTTAPTSSIKACNVHPTAGNTQPYVFKYTDLSSTNAATIGPQQGGYTQVTVNGKTGWVLNNCVI